MEADLPDDGAIRLVFSPAIPLGFVHFVVALPGKGDMIAVGPAEDLPGTQPKANSPEPSAANSM
ncbi:hypothetical protein NKH28_15445 [Mesorhizobium sp. M1227]|uniref:hypothetical protein n=1 Tax=Mesorhizobium sp. M1227 TaxID=2957071 RepID=UPI0033399A08